MFGVNGMQPAAVNPYARDTYLSGGRHRAERGSNNPATQNAMLFSKLDQWPTWRGFVTELNLTEMTNGPITEVPDLIAMGYTGVKKLIVSQSAFEALPENVLKMTQLECLIIDHCPNLKTLAGIERMEGLKVLEAEHCALENVDEIAGTQLTHVNLIGNPIETIGDWPATLREFSLSHTLQEPSLSNEVDEPNFLASFAPTYEETRDGNIVVRYTSTLEDFDEGLGRVTPELLDELARARSPEELDACLVRKERFAILAAAIDASLASDMEL